jgi:ABC-2 type transport system permease protein
MDIIKTSTDWAKAELFSAKIIWLFSIILILGAVAFGYWGRTQTAKAFVIPLIVAGIFLISVGIGLYWANKPRIKQFEKEFSINSKEFVFKEIQRTAKSQKELALVFKILPAIIIVAALFLIFFPAPYCRTICITIILTVAFLMAVDSNTDARNSAYHIHLVNTKL